MLRPFPELLAQAQRERYALGYFEAWDVYSLEAVLEAAESEGTPVILGFGGAMMEPGWLDGGGLERLGALGVATAHAASVPVALLLNEVSSFPQVVRGIQAGFNAVMLDTSGLPFSQNIAMTKKVVEAAHAAGVGVEAELGTLPDASGEMEDHPSALTDPQQAAQFVAETGVDALSVSIGNVHILTNGTASIDFELLEALYQAVRLPLVIHGGTGFPEAAIPRAISLGVAKVNIGTALKQAFLEGVKQAVLNLPPNASIQAVMGSRKETDIFQQGKLAMRREVIRRMRLWKPDDKNEG